MFPLFPESFYQSREVEWRSAACDSQVATYGPAKAIILTIGINKTISEEKDKEN